MVKLHAMNKAGRETFIAFASCVCAQLQYINFSSPASERM